MSTPTLWWGGNDFSARAEVVEVHDYRVGPSSGCVLARVTLRSHWDSVDVLWDHLVYLDELTVCP